MTDKLKGKEVDLEACGKEIATHCRRYEGKIIDLYVSTDDLKLFYWSDIAGKWVETRKYSQLLKSLEPYWDVSHAAPTTSCEDQW